MPITAADLKLYLTGGAANDDPETSLGGVTSSVEFINDTLGELFFFVGPAEALAGSVKYRALTLKNTSAFDAYWLSIHLTETTSADTTVAIGIDATDTVSVVDDETAPAGVSFSTPLTLGTALNPGDLGPAETHRIWFRRTVTAGAAPDAEDSGTIVITIGVAP
jgi:hypothetical protein